uniref:CCHC-type domain-containing protein n=1 Tax=Fagus sylvatica TaxID=28930 RepID=A0A2N9ICC4_FAGSY
MESLEGLWEKFSLSETEGNLVDLISTADQPKSCLAAKFLTRRALNAEAVVRTFKPLWRTDHGFTVRDMNDNILVFAFEDEADRERVMLGEPWAYDKHLVVLQRVEEDEAIAEVEFKYTSFWVQLHGIPVRRMNHEVASILGSFLGQIIHVSDGGDSAAGGQAMRIRVRVDITKQLCRGRRAQLEKNKEIWISFKYERLPNFCYWCGLLTHTEKDCPCWLRNQNTLRVEDQQFGAWMRASNERPWRKTEIKVEGILRKPTPENPHQPPPPSPHPSRYQTHPKHSTPHINPIPSIPPHIPPSPSTSRTIPLPPDNTSAPPLPHSLTTPSPPPSTTFPNPTSTIYPPPQASTPIITLSPSQEDQVVHMDMEENLVCTPLPSQPARQEDHFETQLQEIDSALNLYPPTTESIKQLLDKENVNMIQGPRIVFGDISNTTQVGIKKPTLHTAKRSWKKLARTQNSFAETPLDPIHSKRSSYSLNDSIDNDQVSKKHCGIVNNTVLAEAVGQPRREP